MSPIEQEDIEMHRKEILNSNCGVNVRIQASTF
jgi:hypothetical protein